MAFKFLGKSRAAQRIREEVELAIDCELTVLLYGETGTGKEILAQTIHQESRRTKNTFVTLNCSAMTDTLIESELFGHERGAFTGASEKKQGLCKTAHQGTLFLDEVGDMALGNQQSLLRFMSGEVGLREVRPLGSAITHHVDVRVIAATNKNLGKLVNDRKFRDDLYYRLNVLRIDLPPLRERPEDIRSFIQYFEEEHKVRTSSEVSAGLEEYDWPGNFRELCHVLEVAVARAKHRVGWRQEASSEPPTVIWEDVRLPSMEVAFAKTDVPVVNLDILTLREHMSKFERSVVAAALKAEEFNVSAAAKRLSISRHQMYILLRKHGLWIKSADRMEIAMKMAASA